METTKQEPQAVNRFQHKVRWDRLGRKGQRCEIITPQGIPATMIAVRFEDGFEAVVERAALKRSKAP
jgi:hypothetical protein